MAKRNTLPFSPVLPVASVKFDRADMERTGSMPQVMSCIDMPDGIYHLYASQYTVLDIENTIARALVESEGNSDYPVCLRHVNMTRHVIAALNEKRNENLVTESYSEELVSLMEEFCEKYEKITGGLPDGAGVPTTLFQVFLRINGILSELT